MKFFLILFSAMLFSCTTTKSSDYGIQAEYKADIPAQTLIMPCSQWPKANVFKSEYEFEAKPEDLSKICEAYDKFVLEAYKNQPFMRGISPSLLKKLFAKEPQKLDWQSLWTPTKVDSNSLSQLTPVSYYQKYISHQLNWRHWLNQTSLATKSSDAILLPVVLSVTNKMYDDRGLPVWRKEVKIVSFLIDTTNANLIWSGFSSGANVRSKLPHAPDLIIEPEWNFVFDKIFTPDHWQYFPGRR